MVLAILPPHISYVSIKIKADKYLVRAKSQILSIKNNNFKFSFFDELVDQNIGQHYNKRAISESINIGYNNGEDCTKYKSISIGDINFVQTNLCIFNPTFREALAFLTLVDKYNPSKIIVSSNDPYHNLFVEISQKLSINITIIDDFGESISKETQLIKSIYKQWDNFDWHPPIRHKFYSRIIMLILNTWSYVVRAIRGNKKNVAIIFYNPLIPIREKLLLNNQFYTLFISPIKMKLREIIISGLRFIPFKEQKNINSNINQLLKVYYLTINAKSWSITTNNKKVNITKFINNKLRDLAPNAFKQIINNIDSFGRLIKKHQIKAFLTYGDSPWRLRLLVRLFQKNSIPSIVIMNGWLGDDFSIEGKTADITLCYSKSILDNYFKTKNNSIIINNPLFTQAYNKKYLIKPNYPIKKILIGTFTYVGFDINVHYSDHEKYIEDIVSTLIEIQRIQKFEFEISIKTHPSDPKGYYAWFINKLGFEKLNIIETGNFQKIVADFDFVIMSYSTAIFESALMGIPVLFYHPSKQMLYEPFNGKSPLPSAFSKKELFVTLNKIMSNIEFANQFLKSENLFPYTGEVNKLKRSNIVNVLLDSIEIKKEKSK